MNKHYLPYLILLFHLNVFGQPVFNQPNFNLTGTTVTSYDLDATGLTPGNSGGGQSWNFAAATSLGTSSSGTFLAPSATPYASTYPSANLAYQTISTGGNDAYAFYNLNSGYLDLVGTGTHSPTVDILFTYSDPNRIANFPYSFNSTVNDNFTAYATYNISSLVYQDYQTGTFSVVADAYGSITTPGGNFSNCLRNNVIRNTVDSIVIAGFPGGFITRTRSHSHTWMTSGYFFPVFTLNNDSVDGGTGWTVTSSASYTSIGSGVNENSNNKPLTVYPNPAPASSRINLSVDELDGGPTTFYAIDMQGRIAKQLDFVFYPTNHKSVSIDMSDCQSGLYNIRLVQKEKTYSTKFVIN